MKIRKATIEDFEGVKRLFVLLFVQHSEYNYGLETDWPGESKGEECIKNFLTNPKHYTLVCEEDNQIVGYLTGSLEESPDYLRSLRIAEINTTFIDERFRNKKIGSELTNRFTIWAKENGANTLIVDVLSENSRGINFYKLNGFNDYRVIIKKDLK
ncbi:TPA: hypothetical protein DDW69_03490 [candidate division CPR2 bacterium]|uniref:GCN5-related N-acetyltransferase n=1 Tax=candidate division CPR2 bacterium GW2011_GWC1_41_48 TaxID=1618344 RepID=A0A0G0Z7P5_UNCC2|nr:MAG: GCN5-related N-acetyltransferase [candidate division CPR2 bacterium GW2011_GWC2_39_35]KKR27777.1 MAG: GCN5-related N-acetyltransferase [candidate division CPR2 bacterium GW2011_GWD1_39_7]KKR28794.1 MAG: GCN5-related N-acetyltransferase [candidate division CPR2 bacterium GW2011_GWD2_39_7]KKS09048.1 MAG: GCN5-related N-acetyltransferase [candidate division CPR2 bacterium GW2011_GWC1_41_48]OGB59795.1 MAG: hypothetical protein A2Y27_00015 [candidate division CPR2 bacterium GWD1_39_7]OGB731